MVAAQVIEAAAQRLGRLDAHDQRGDLIDVRDDAVRIDQHHAVFEAFDDRFGLALLVDDALDVHAIVMLEALRHLVELARNLIEFGQRLRPEPDVAFALADAAQALRQFGQRTRQRPSHPDRKRGADQQQNRESGGDLVSEMSTELASRGCRRGTSRPC